MGWGRGGDSTYGEGTSDEWRDEARKQGGVAGACQTNSKHSL